MITLRAITLDDIEHGYAATQRVNWPHRREDWQQIITLAEGVVAEEHGEFAGCALGWRWGERAATIGLVMVNPAFRGRGIGKQLMQAIMARFPGYTLRLHATEMGKGLYAQLGFVETGTILQYQTRALTTLPPLTLPADTTLRAAQAADADALTACDWQAHGLHRPALIQQLLSAHRTVLLADAQQQVQGFASLRRFGHGWTIGPIIARDLSQAQALIAALMPAVQGQFVRIDTDARLPLAAWLAELGMTQVDSPCMMVRGTPWQPPIGGMQAFGLMSQAMG